MCRPPLSYSLALSEMPECVHDMVSILTTRLLKQSKPSALKCFSKSNEVNSRSKTVSFKLAV